jgi:uncharacterized membrane-anchored protein
MNRKIALTALVAILLIINWSIASKERHLSEGAIVYLELAPVDPRSLMQGDYMALRFKLTNDIYSALPKSEGRRPWRRAVEADDGHVIVKLDQNRVGTFHQIYSKQPLQADEVFMQYRVRSGEVKLATNAFFFQEGAANLYQTARFGQFKVNKQGEILLSAMYDKALKHLGPKR